MKILIGFIALFFATTLSAQESDKWELIQSKEGVNFYRSLTNCNIPEDGLYANYYLLKIENSNKYPIQIQWKNDIFYNGQCRNCNEKYLPQFQAIQAESAIEGQCSPYSDQYLRVFHSWNNKANPDKFTGLRISKIIIKTPH